MTDEHKSNINSNSSNSSDNNNSNNNNTAASSSSSNNNNNCNESSNNNTSGIIAEAAAKFLLKNGLNGSSSNSFPPLPPPLAANLSRTTTPTSTPTPTPTPSSCSSTPTNGFLPHAKTPKSSSIMAASAAVAATIVGATASKPSIDVLGGVLDYSSLGAAATGSLPTTASSAGTVKIAKGSSSGGSFDMGRTPISTHGNSNNSWGGYGGRLQFFKDGKFILELARSKDGDKSGWVSVTRKTFRPPSAATSATVTPTSAVTTAYPKNENSTSLSFSDDNSSIQSSPWQRDQPWKQSRPRRGISKELSLFYHRPRNSALGRAALRTASRKRRRPHEPLTTNEEQQPMFEVAVKAENGDDTLKAETAEVEEGGAQSENSANEIKTEKSETIKREEDAEGPEKAVNDDSESKEAASALKVDVQPKDETVEKMNTSEDEEAVTAPLTVSTIPVNGDLNGELIARVGKPKPIQRAKLSSIIQKLIDGVPARLEQMSKTPVATATTTTASAERSGGGVIGSLGHSLTHKVSPPSSASAASRLVEYHHQHVSPRKRILREFEKVSLEDNGCVNNGSGGGSSGGAGGKRSRAKASSTSSAAAKASPINLAPPQGKPSPSPGSSSSSTSPAAASTQPTRLNSSYSIHSLLGGSSGSGSSSSSSGKKSGDHPAAIISNVHHPHHSLYQSSSSGYPRALLTSPKSPEVTGSNGGGKSPSHAGAKKRSPPYTAGSPLPVDYGHSFYRDPYAGAGRPTTTSSASQDLSPPRSSPASPATTPRTVPKKTASIRREFASPSASSSSCPSPGDRSASPPDRRHMQQQHLQRSSPLHYYMYPPPPQVNGNGSGGSPTSAPVTSSSSAAAVAAAAAAAATYIPSVVSPSLYHPYISTLAAMRHNPLWMHHYPAGASALLPPHPQAGSSAAAAAAAVAAAARLSPQSPYHAFAYNGVGAAAVAAAAAAAAFGQPAPSPHTHPHLAHPHQHPHPAGLTTHHSPAHMATPKLTDSSTDQMSAASSHRTASTSPSSSSASATSGASSSAMFHTSNLRNEQSSDLPLNLSKH
uniref:Protein hairless n=1 Tax=Drosophila rhopaloa TaxID=1041015 RepID=A0A6P4ER76_DRORH